MSTLSLPVDSGLIDLLLGKHPRDAYKNIQENFVPTYLAVIFSCCLPCRRADVHYRSGLFGLLPKF